MAVCRRPRCGTRSRGGGRGSIRDARARVRPPGIPQQDFTRAHDRPRRRATSRVDPGVLWLLRLALGRPRPLAPDSIGSSVPRRGVRPVGAGGDRSEPHAGQDSGRSSIPCRGRPDLVRAPLRARLVASARRRAPRMGRPRGSYLERNARAAGAPGGAPNSRVVTETDPSDPGGRACADGVRVRPHSRLGARGRRP